MITNVEEIKDAAQIADIVGDFIPLKKHGVNLTACCPFHDERTPSFNVSPARGIFKCFGCGKGGDAITFLQEYKSLTYRDAIEFLAKKYHIPVQYALGVEDRASEKEAIQNTLAAAHAHFYFVADNPGRAYFQARGLEQETLEEFGVGYCPGVSGPKVSTQELQVAGLANERGNLSFYQRATIPIRDHRGAIVSFAGRVITGDGLPKYLNGAESAVFQKGRHLFGLSNNRENIKKYQLAVMVEGYTDVMALWQYGCQQAVATCGTAVTEDQCRLLSNYTNSAVFLFDGDEAGRKAAHRAALIAYPFFENLRICFLPEGSDPDTFIREHGTDEFYNIVYRKWAEGGIFYCTHGQKWTTERGKREIGRRLLDLLKQITEAPRRAAFLNTLAEHLDTPVTNLMRFVFPVISEAHATAYASFRAQFAQFDQLIERRARWCIKQQEADTTNMDAVALQAHNAKIERVEDEIEVMDNLRSSIWAIEEIYLSHLKT